MFENVQFFSHLHLKYTKSAVMTQKNFSSLCVLPPHQRRCGTHTPGCVSGWGVNILEDARHRLGLLQSWNF
jgi:hypothetical protein